MGLALQILKGLTAAHDHGVIHRDLKPKNISLTTEETAKILHFGLAKLTRESGEIGEDSTGATLSMKTQSGVVRGPASYMSLEQGRGERVDARSDLFAIGCILYEMLAGRQVFARSSRIETMNAVCKDERNGSRDLEPGSSPR